jgi:hypothetical protein
VAVTAGIATTGYSLLSLGPGGSDVCGVTPPSQPTGVGQVVETGKVGGTVLVLMGAAGAGNLVPQLEGNGPGTTCPSGSGNEFRTLQNVTVSKGPDDGGAVGAFTFSMPPNTYCEFFANATSFNEPNVDYSMWQGDYLLVPSTS